MSDYLQLYGPRFFRKRNRWAHDQRIAGQILQKELRIGSAVDFGCGIGTVMQGMGESGCRTLGVEHNAELARRHSPIPDRIVQGDVTVPMDLGVFEWAMCIEVAEHVPTPTSEQLVRNLARHCLCGVIFSAAPPGQRGTGHINCQTREFWETLFRDHGLLHKPVVSDHLRRLLGARTRLHWLRDNLMIFRTTGRSHAQCTPDAGSL